MKRAWDALVAMFSRREDATRLALFRAAVGLSLLWALLPVWLNGALAMCWLRPEDGGYSTREGGWLTQLLGGSPQAIHALFIVALLSAVLITCGLGGRITPALGLLSYLALSQRNRTAGGSYDHLLTNALWLLVLAQATTTLSLDCRLRTGCWRSTQHIPSWPRMLAVYQLVLCYFSTGLHKVADSWLPTGGYSALYYILQQPTWQRFDMRWLASVYPLTQLATLGAWLFEVSSPLLLVLLARRGPRRDRAVRAWMAFGVGMHLAILALMDVGPFSAIAISYYFCLFSAPAPAPPDCAPHHSPAPSHSAQSPAAS